MRRVELIGKVKARRAGLKITIEDLAKLSEVGFRTITRFFAGHNIKLDSLEKITRTLGLDLAGNELVSIEELLDKRAEQKAAKQKELEKKKAEEAKAQHAKAEPKAQQAQSGGYYIQVGYFNDPQTISGLAAKITSAGFTAKTKDGTKSDKNITKVWVGPFNTKEDADKALPKVRKQIRSDAFIVKG